MLDKPVMALVRLASSAHLDDLTEVDLPTKFMFVAFGPSRCMSVDDCEELGRSIGSLFNDRVLCAFINQDRLVFQESL